MIAGTTSYDTNMVALNAIFADWTRTDLSFEQRMADLISPGNNKHSLNGKYTLDKKNVFDAGGSSTLIGGSTSLSWFFVTDTTTYTAKPRDHVTSI